METPRRVGTLGAMAGPLDWKGSTLCSVHAGSIERDDYALGFGRTGVPTPMATPTIANANLLQIERTAMKLTLVSDGPLVCHAWSSKAKQMMLDKQMKKATATKAAKDPWLDFCESLYWLDGMPLGPTQEDVDTAAFGFPVIAFKAAAIGACRWTELKMTEMRGAFHIDGEFARIQSDPPCPRQDMVRVGMGTADIRYRGEFKKWSVTLSIVFNARAISAEQLINLFQLAGFGVGVGEWRPEKDGSWGIFHVDKSAADVDGAA